MSWKSVNGFSTEVDEQPTTTVRMKEWQKYAIIPRDEMSICEDMTRTITCSSLKTHLMNIYHVHNLWDCFQFPYAQFPMASDLLFDPIRVSCVQTREV